MHKIEYCQRVPISLEQCFDFFSTPRNLKLLTPSYLGFTESSDDGPMYEGQIIIHTLTPIFAIRLEWVTEITHIKKLDYFVDEQRIGPYKLWHHEHRFHALADGKGTEIIDKIHYLLPFGPLGKLMNHLKVKKDLREIFSYRHRKISEIFGSFS